MAQGVGSVARAFVALALVVGLSLQSSLGVAAALVGQSSAGADEGVIPHYPLVLTYSEEVPCLDKPKAAAFVRHVHHHRRPRRRVAAAAHQVRPAKPVVHVARVAPAHVHRIRHYILHVRHVPRKPALFAGAPVQPVRCNVIHRDQLFEPAVAAGPAPFVLASDVVEPTGSLSNPALPAALSQPGQLGGEPIAGAPAIPGAYGGDHNPSSAVEPPPPPPVSSAPEPAAWLLYLLGTGLVGCALRAARFADRDRRKDRQVRC